MVTVTDAGDVNKSETEWDNNAAFQNARKSEFPSSFSEFRAFQ